MKGMIALDIDGTITANHHDLDPDVASFFEKLTRENWQLVFITGRTFAWGYEVLQNLSFPYYFAVQNGAIILDMPSRKTVSKKYLDVTVIPLMDEICSGEKSDYVIYTGYENNDICYYRPHKFDPKLLHYVQNRVSTLKEQWIPLKSYDDLPLTEFPSIKCFGDAEDAERISEKITQKLGLFAPLIKDPYNMSFYVVQATYPEINKGYALKECKKLLGIKGPIIAAGDDNNDRDMLKAAQIKVVMATAPKDMLLHADVVAPPAKENGIISGLTQAIALALSTL